MMIMLMKPVVLGAGVAKGQGFPPLSSPLLALMINVTFARECAIVFELIGLLLSSRRGVFFSLRDQQCVLYSCASYYQRTTPCYRNKTTELRRTELYILLSSVPGQNGKREVLFFFHFKNRLKQAFCDLD